MVGPSDQCRRSAFNPFGSSCQEKSFFPSALEFFARRRTGLWKLRRPHRGMPWQKHATVKMEFVDNTPTGLAGTYSRRNCLRTNFTRELLSYCEHKERGLYLNCSVRVTIPIRPAPNRRLRSSPRSRLRRLITNLRWWPPEKQPSQNGMTGYYSRFVGYAATLNYLSWVKHEVHFEQMAQELDYLHEVEHAELRIARLN